jgi:tRNA-2-methylthio-N6-dimethylallyladenosine synthase
MNRKVFIRTLGCQMNKLDTALFSAALKQAGYSFCGSIADADVVILNTCSVRQHAEDRVLSHLGHLKYAKKSRPDLVVAVTGCMAQRLGPELLRRHTVEVVCGPAQIPHLPELITQALHNKQKSVAITEKIRQKPDDRQRQLLETFEAAYETAPSSVPGQAYVRAMHGCDKFCSYCVVPYVRGPELCRSPNAILEQIRKLADNGIKQITLLGQTINSYKYTAGQKTYRLADLLEMAATVGAIKWIRFITSYPADFDESILRAMAGLPKLCPYLHIPAQSGSDRILKAMNRHYTAAEYLALLEKARQLVPGIAISGDLIVGFPGETDEDFQATVELVKKARYKSCFVFKYSTRPATAADRKLTDNVPLQLKARRNTHLLEIQNQISCEDNRRFLSQTLEVLVEGLSKKPHLDKRGGGDGTQLVGRTATDHIVVFDGPERLAGEFAKVAVTKTSALTLFGELVGEG